MTFSATFPRTSSKRESVTVYPIESIYGINIYQYLPKSTYMVLNAVHGSYVYFDSLFHTLTGNSLIPFSIFCGAFEENMFLFSRKHLRRL